MWPRAVYRGVIGADPDDPPLVWMCMTDAREIELKFLCEPHDLDKILAASPPGADETRELVSVYFDTTAGDLRAKGVSLRVRHSGERRLQTVKRGAGLSREEHEAEIVGDRPDPLVGPLKKLLSSRGVRALKPVFEVRVKRRQRLFHHGAATVELALDEGDVRAGRRSSPISEVELELKSGDPAALYAAARDLAGAAPLYLSFDSKATQGEALLAGTLLKARHSAPIVLPRRATAADAFQATARQALAQIAANAALLREAQGAEAVHQLRVGVRRLRSALSTFSPLFASREAKSLKSELAWLAKSCDAARNLEVFATETIAPAPPATPGLAALSKAVEGALAKGLASAAQAASSERFRRLMIDAAAWIETGPWRETRRKAREEPVADFAARRLGKRLRKVLKAGADLAELDDEGRHHLRIAAKKLRYSADALGGPFPSRAVGGFARRLKGLQDELGALNDLATAGPLVAGLRLTPDAALAAGELLGALEARKPRLIARAAKAFGKLADTEPFWRG